MSRTVLAATLLLIAPLLGAQEPERDLSMRVRAALPAAEAARVNATAAAALLADLPDGALQLMALELAAKRAPAPVIAARVERRLDDMIRVRALLHDARGRATGDEVVAGAEALSRGVTGAQVAELARSAPSGRSLAVALLVTTELMDRGLPSDHAIEHVRVRLAERATDAALRGEVLAASRSAAAIPARGPGPVPLPRPEPRGRGSRPPH